MMKTLVELLEVSAQKYGSNPYLLEKKAGRYEKIAYKETRKQVYKIAAGILAHGCEFLGLAIASYF